MEMHPLQIRPLGSDAQKSIITREMWKGPKLELGSQPFNEVQHKVAITLIDRGLDTNSYLTAADGKVQSIVLHPEMFVPENALQQYKNLQLNFDCYETLNDRSATNLILDFMGPKLASDVSKYFDSADTAGFPPIWFEFCKQFLESSALKKDALKKAIEAIVITNYERQNVTEMTKDLSKKCRELEGIKAYDHDLTPKILRKFLPEMGCQGNSEFINMVTSKLSEVREAHIMIQFHLPTAQDAHMRQQRLDWKSLLGKVDAAYIQAKSQGLWGPAKEDSLKQEHKIAFLQQVGKKLQRENRALRNGMNGNKDHAANKSGNGDREEKKDEEKQSGKSGKKKGKRKKLNKWKRPPSASHRPTECVNDIKHFEKEIHGTTHHWCATCKLWNKSHWTDEHDSEDESTDSESTEGDQTATDADINFVDLDFNTVKFF